MGKRRLISGTVGSEKGDIKARLIRETEYKVGGFGGG